MLVAVETLNVDAASFAQMEEAARQAGLVGEPAVSEEVAHIVLRTVTERGKQHNPVTGSGGMLLGRVLQVGAGRLDSLRARRPVATLVSLSLTPLRVDRVRAVRRASAQIDVDGEAVALRQRTLRQRCRPICPSASRSRRSTSLAPRRRSRVSWRRGTWSSSSARAARAACCARRRRAVAGGRARASSGSSRACAAAEDLRALGLCDAVVSIDARDAVAVRRAVLDATGGREADVTLSCVNVADAEMAAVLVTRDRGVVYFFAMSTSFTRAALGAEGVGKDVDLFIGNGYAHGHAEHTLALLRDGPGLRALFERRYG